MGAISFSCAVKLYHFAFLEHIENSSFLVFFLSLTVNLAFGDVLLIIISLPTSAVIYNLETWPFGEAMCKISYSIRTLSLGKSKEKTIP